MDITLVRDRAVVHSLDAGDQPVQIPDVVRERPQMVDQDVHKGAIEDGRQSPTTNAPGLDDDGLPNDQTAIAQDAIGARVDGSQG